MITGKRFSRLYLKATGAVFCKGGFGGGYHFVIRVSWEWAKTLVPQGFLHLRRLFPLYYRGKIVGGIYDDRFLVKPTKSALERMPDADREIPYEGAREMLLVDNVDNRELLTELLTSMYDELPEPKKKK